MKQYISRVENSLNELFPGKEIKVLCCYDQYATELHEEGNTFDTTKEKRIYQTILCYDEKMYLVKNTGIFIHTKDVEPYKDHFRYATDKFGRRFKKALQFEFKGILFQEVDKKDNDNIRKMQFACGFKKTAAPASKQNLTPYQFLKKHCQTFADIYKMLKELSETQFISGQFIHEGQTLRVQSANGKYQFPLKNICDTCPDEEIIRLFCDLFQDGYLKNNPLLNHFKKAA